jgi:hypothetical protein
VYPDQYGVDLAALADLIDQALRHDSVPAFTPIKERDGNAVVSLNVLAEEFVTGMNLPGVGWVTCRQASLQQRPRRRAAASRDSSVEDLDAGVLVLVNMKERLKSHRLSSRCPPGEHLQLLWFRAA